MAWESRLPVFRNDNDNIKDMKIGAYIDRFLDEHPSTATVVAFCVWISFFAVLAMCTSCKGTQKVVEIVRTDTLHIVHSDTVRLVHNDTIYSVVKEVMHDSIIRETIIKEVVNEAGEVIHSEKETNNEVWHNSDTNSQLIWHTVDSLVQAKMDSINHVGYAEKPVVVEVEKEKAWYAKVWGWIVGRFAWIGLAVVIGFVVWMMVRYLKPKI